MNMNPEKRNMLTNCTCIVLLSVMLVLQFMPFWHYGGERPMATSINGYIWFPMDHKELTDYLQENAGEDFEVDQILIMPIFNLIAGFFGIIFCIAKPHAPAARILPTICGLVGIWGYLSKAVFRLGSNWGVHLLVCAALLIVAGGSLIDDIRQMKLERN